LALCTIHLTTLSRLLSPAGSCSSSDSFSANGAAFMWAWGQQPALKARFIQKQTRRRV
jgi:hypothetical protein